MLFRLENPLALLGFIPVVILLGVMIWLGLKRGALSWRRLALALAGFSLCVFGMARPQWGSRVAASQGMRTNVVIAIDISRSMLAQDISPSRLAFGIAFTQKLLQQVNGVKVAIFPFAADGYMQIPFTTDLMAAADMMTPLSPTMTTNQGTNLTTVLTTLFGHLARMEATTREKGDEWMPTQVVLITDGESHEPLKGSILREFRAKHIPIYTVAAGTTSGMQIMIEGKYGLGREMLRDTAGNAVISKLYPDTLKKIASETGGDYFAPRFEEVYRLKDRLQQAGQVAKLSTTFKLEKEYFPLLFTLALLAFCLEFGLGRWEYAIRGLLMGLMLSGAATGEPLPEAEEALPPATRAMQAYNQGVKEAERSPQRAAELFQESAGLTDDPVLKKKALFNLGNTLLKLSDPTQALQAYQGAHDIKSGDRSFDQDANQRISDNIVLAAKILEKMKSQSQEGEGKPSPDAEGKGKGEQDPKGPRTEYDPQSFSSMEKQKIFDLLSQEEQQTMSRLQEQRNRNKPRQATEKTW